MRRKRGAIKGHDWLHAKILHHGAVRLHDNWVQTYMSDPQWRLYFNLDAGGAVYIDEQRYELQPEQIYVLPAWINWRGSVEQPFRHMFFGVDIPMFSQAIARKHWPLPILLQDTEEVRHDWTQHCARWLNGKDQQAGDYARWYSIMYRILELLFDQHPAPTGGMPKELIDITNYIEMHLDADLSNEHLAEKAYCSSGHLIRRFSKLLGQSPANYVRERRLTAAANRLAYTDDSIDAISDTLGFPNRHYFTRVFHKMMHYPPAKYRKLFRLN